MEKRISAANANRKFSELLRGVRKGKTYVVTSHGKPVARISPSESDADASAGARSALLARLKSQPAAKGAKARRRWTREELYEAE